MTVYFIRRQGDDTEIKIGTAVMIERRLVTVAASVGPIELIGHMRGGEAVERLIHSKFALDRVEGEWFRNSEALRDFIRLEAPCDTKLFEPKANSWKKRAVNHSWDLDQRAAKTVMDALISEFPRDVTITSAHEKIFQRLNERNGVWSRRRVRAIHELAARRIDVFEMIDLLTLLDIPPEQWADWIRPKQAGQLVLVA